MRQQVVGALWPSASQSRRRTLVKALPQPVKVQMYFLLGLNGWSPIDCIIEACMLVVSVIAGARARRVQELIAQAPAEFDTLLSSSGVSAGGGLRTANTGPAYKKSPTEPHKHRHYFCIS